MERFSYYLRDAFASAGYSATILAREDIVGFSARLLRWSRLVGMQQPLLGWLLGRMAERRGFDVCFTNGMLGWNLRGKRVVNVQHGTFARAAVRIDKGRFLLKYLMKFHCWARFEGLAARRAAICVAVSNETRESVELYYAAKNVRVIPNAVDTERFKPLGIPKKNQAIFVGRFEYAKGKGILEGMRSFLEGRGWSLAVAETLSQEELATAYNESRVFLLPSLHEGCSYALLDAMSCGLPFLASPVGLVSDFASEGLFSECIVAEQSVGAYITKFEALAGMSGNESSRLTGTLRDYILRLHSIEDFNRSYVSLALEQHD